MINIKLHQGYEVLQEINTNRFAETDDCEQLIATCKPLYIRFSRPQHKLGYPYIVNCSISKGRGIKKVGAPPGTDCKKPRRVYITIPFLHALIDSCKKIPYQFTSKG